MSDFAVEKIIFNPSSLFVQIRCSSGIFFKINGFRDNFCGSENLSLTTKLLMKHEPQKIKKVHTKFWRKFSQKSSRKISARQD